MGDVFYLDVKQKQKVNAAYCRTNEAESLLSLAANERSQIKQAINCLHRGGKSIVTDGRKGRK